MEEDIEYNGSTPCIAGYAPMSDDEHRLIAATVFVIQKEGGGIDKYDHANEALYWSYFWKNGKAPVNKKANVVSIKGDK